MKKVGFTTTIPVEVILAAGCKPVDLNNIFISSDNPMSFIEEAHSKNMPRNICSWIKALYSAALTEGVVDEIVSVSNGDCSNTSALSELYESNNIKVHYFSYPSNISNGYSFLKEQISNLCNNYNISYEELIAMMHKVDKVRDKLAYLDKLTVEGKVSGFENHLWLVSSSDFNGDLEKFSADLDCFIKEAEVREEMDSSVIRLGYIGVPPIIPKLYDFFESKGARVIFNEVQRQFSIISRSDDYIERFLTYTYPYDIYKRIDDIKVQIEERKLEGIIHYVQTFCHRQIQDIIIREKLGIPVLTVEADAPNEGEIDNRTKIRIDSFIEMLQARRLKRK